MARLIDADELTISTAVPLDGKPYQYVHIDNIKAATTVDAVPVCRCKDCKHRPTKPEGYRDGFDLEFPDDACPCKCEDPFYSRYPRDDWFCPKGECK